MPMQKENMMVVAWKAIRMASTSRSADGRHAEMAMAMVASIVGTGTHRETTKATQVSVPTRRPPVTVVEVDTRRCRASAVQGTDAEGVR